MKTKIEHLLDEPIAHRAGGHIVFGSHMIAATANAGMHNGWLWTEGEWSAHMANGGEYSVFPPEWAEIVLELRRRPRGESEQILSEQVETSQGKMSIAEILCNRYRIITRCNCVAVRVFDADAFDETDTGNETKIRYKWTATALDWVRDRLQMGAARI